MPQSSITTIATPNSKPCPGVRNRPTTFYTVISGNGSKAVCLALAFTKITKVFYRVFSQVGFPHLVGLEVKQHLDLAVSLILEYLMIALHNQNRH
jgi:hypothetical protein